MKSSTVPTICGVALAAMSAAGVSHWWSVRQFVTAMGPTLPQVVQPIAPPEPAKADPPATKAAVAPALAAAPTHNPESIAASQAQAQSQKEFFEALLKEVKTLRTENLNLVDQMAETNRDLMKLEFRVDTHSESFRPLPVSEERQDTSFDDGPGVLPPRAEPVFPTSGE